jgi:glucosylglycerol-phosphate synthase
MLLATDLDGTFLGGKQIDKLNLYRLIQQRDDICLVFVTGRGLETVLPLLNDSIVPHPDYIICDVGATIVDGKTLEHIEPLQSEIESKWTDVFVLKDRLARVQGLSFQEVPQQRRCSYYYNEDTDLDEVYAIAEEYNCDVITSLNLYLDFLPRGVNKGSALKKLVEILQFDPNNVLVAGDTLNDYALYTVGFKGVAVGGAEQLLLDRTADIPHVYSATREGAGGILEAMVHFPKFGFYYKEYYKTLETKTSKTPQLLMVYHRLPFEKRIVDGKTERLSPKSPNGIIPSLLGFFENGQSGVWIGEEEIEASGITEAPNEYIDKQRYPNLTASTIYLHKKDIDRFYRVFSKEAFWPVIFSFIEKAEFKHEDWEHYLHINKLFAERIAREADKGALVWIHEYNLWMVPAYLKALRPDVKIAFFHHTSFPPADIFNIIPWRKEIIGSLLLCDFISFHIPRYVENFVDVLRSHTPFKVVRRINAAKQFLTYSMALGVDKMTKVIEVSGRKIRLGAQPVGVNVKNIQNILQTSETNQLIGKLKQQVGDKKIILSVERLDYVKGPLEKIKAYGEFLDEHPEYHGKVELINICTPPSRGMTIYDDVQKEIEQAVGEINGRYSSLEWTPIQFFFRSIPFEEVIAYYAISDVAWITPLRDGLNLVAKEYVAVQGCLENPKGVLVISEFAGASVELPYAIFTNPYDIKSLKDSLLQALSMDPEDSAMRIQRLYEAVRYYDIEYWGKDFIREFERSITETN